MSQPPIDELIAVGIIRKPHGVRGEASVESLTDSLQRFAALSHVWLVSPDRSRVVEAHVRSSRTHTDRALVLFKEFDAPEQLRDYQNWTIEVEPGSERELDEDEVFIHDLIGLRVIENDAELGVVDDAFDVPGGLLLSVKRSDGKSFDLPFADSLIEEVDVEGGVLRVQLPEGLTDLDSIVAVEDEARDEADHASDEDARDHDSSEPPIPDQKKTTDAEVSDAPAVANPPAAPSLIVDVITIFPAMFDALTGDGVLARGIKRGIVSLNVRDLRRFATDKHQSTDDEAYGGGGGMVMLAEPIFRAIDQVRADSGEERPWVIAMTPQGKVFSQAKAHELAAKRRLVFLCGRYEGFDERVMTVVDEELSIGDFVVTGGELPAMLMIDAISRMIDGVVGTRNSVEKDSFYNGLLDYPHYTRPAELRGLAVPEVLISGHFERIRQWRMEQSLRSTFQKRPDLLEHAELDQEARKMLEKIRSEAER
jgi:tRNA (guanine37-N1)-methyltransferase